MDLLLMPVVPILTANGAGERWIPRHRTARRWLCVAGVVGCVPFVYLLAPVMGLLLWWGLRAAAFTIEVDPEGVVYHGAWGDRSVRWEQVRRFVVEVHETSEGSITRLVATGGDLGPRPIVAKSWLFGVDDLHDIAHWLDGWGRQSMRARRAA